MTTEELIKNIQDQTGLKREEVEKIVKNSQVAIGQELASGGQIQIPGYGNLTLAEKPAEAEKPVKDEKQIKIVPVKSEEPLPEQNTPPLIPQKFHFPYADLSKITVDKKVLALIPEHIARYYQIVPLKEEKDILTVAMINPEDREAVEFIKRKTSKELSLQICTQADLNHVLDQYSSMSAELKNIVKESEGDEDILKPKEKIHKEVSEADITETAPAAKIVQSLVKRAVREKASDIHIEPTEEEVIVRFRVDGVLRKVITLPIDILPAIVSRIKILSGMKIDETRLPQDGRFQTVIDDAEVDFRISTFPTVNGEKVVSRILDKSAGILTLESLGLRGSAFEAVKNNISKSHGMILATGPTGSGKTTTLYAVLQKLMKESVNIVTLEDPVEYRIPTINQGQVHNTIGFSFASGLRSILRQDPDIVMIGEIRDQETANMAVHAALTGHIVLSTLHTNDAAGAVPRFLDMGIEPFLVNSSLNAVIAQRLARKICENCREPFKPDPANLAEAQKEIENLPKSEKKPEKIQFFHGKGCANCSDTGYRGRVGIYEVFSFSDDLKALVSKRVSSVDLGKKAVENGMVTMRQDGILKAIEGVTTLEEVWRVARE